VSLSRKELDNFLKELLNPQEFQDYCPNGLQIEGKEIINKIAFAVSAQRHSVETAVLNKADCLIVHHGLFWKFHGTRTVTGPFAKRVKPLIQNDINLFGYHLPLDAHIEYGNAAAIAKKIGLTDLSPFGDYKGSPTGVQGKFKSPLSPDELTNKLEQVLNHNILHSNPNGEQISSMGIITGGANSEWRLCLRAGLDSYLTGEMSEHDWHESREDEIHMFAGGHNATEQFGVQEIMKLIEQKFDVECFFIPSENPA
jgi:dinuclear metal center YbgI/SA1388 family protein